MSTIKTSDGKVHEITHVDFKTSEEPWVEYSLEDGTKLKFRASIVSVVRSDQFDEHGSPFYFVKTQNQVRTYCKDELKCKDQEIKQDEEEPQGYR